MPEIGTLGLMSGDGKRSAGHRPQATAPTLDSTALALWFGLGVFVCFADAAIAASSSGGSAQVAFHMSSGVLCAGLAVLLGRIAGLTTIRA